ncbi:hypothetical protein EVG20_g10500 [Dentipellis fragilis]|uniref:Uncharacterized protein n=1 Tax=Dentipellis fragilis TaxID=205917 RepID=A0A4Y9XR21_9AGAM|nr:hypothetical protein EVG20_g10500 [Dentipellis fragilis]
MSADQDETPAVTKSTQVIDGETVEVYQLNNFNLEDHMKKLAEKMRSNPFVPPVEGCPINTLPNELLSYIFTLGAQLDIADDKDEEEIDDNDSDEEDEPTLEFQVLTSHVCKRWRDVAIQTPSLWTRLDFTEGPPFGKSKTYIERSAGCPLVIDIDCTVPDDDSDEEEEEEVEEVEEFDETEEVVQSDAAAPDDEPKSSAATKRKSRSFGPADLDAIRALILPHVNRWRIFELMTEDYAIMHHTLGALATAPAAEQLKMLHLYHYDDTDDIEHFEPAELRAPVVPFAGQAPQLVNVALWGVHVDWPRCDFFQGLEELELAYHAQDPQAYASALLERLVFPNVSSLALDLEEEDYSAFIMQLAAPLPGKTKSLLSGLQELRLSGLPCNDAAIDKLYASLPNVVDLHLNRYHLEEPFFTKLFPQAPGAASSSAAAGDVSVPLPSLQNLSSSGVDGEQMHQLAEARIAAGRPLKKVFMEIDDLVEPDDEKWLREHLERFEFFEGSDDEDELEIDGIEIMSDDGLEAMSDDDDEVSQD